MEIKQKPGNVIFINGTSSSGKSTLARELQDVFDEPYAHMSLDKFFFYIGRLFDPDITIRDLEENPYIVFDHNNPRLPGKKEGDVVQVYTSVFHNTIVGLARAGYNVVVDYVFYYRYLVHELHDLLIDVPTTLVGLHCPLEILEEREKTRTEGLDKRKPGLPRKQIDVVHSHFATGGYDIEVDTSVTKPREAALQVVRFVQEHSPHYAFRDITIKPVE